MRRTVRQLVYLSRAVDLLDDDAVVAIHTVSQERNARDELTGLLLFDGARFLQALEGEADKVEAAMNRIGADSRHSHIEIAARHDVATRQFGAWAMGYCRRPPGGSSRDFVAQIKEGIGQVTDPGLQAVFIGFASLAPR